MLCPHVWNAQSSGPSIFLWDTRSLTCGVRAMSCVRTLLASSSCSSATPSASSCFLLWFWLTSCFTTRLWYADSSCCCSYNDIKTVQHSPSEHLHTPTLQQRLATATDNPMIERGIADICRSIQTTLKHKHVSYWQGGGAKYLEPFYRQCSESGMTRIKLQASELNFSF